MRCWQKLTFECFVWKIHGIRHTMAHRNAFQMHDHRKLCNVRCHCAAVAQLDFSIQTFSVESRSVANQRIIIIIIKYSLIFFLLSLLPVADYWFLFAVCMKNELKLLYNFDRLICKFFFFFGSFITRVETFRFCGVEWRINWKSSKIRNSDQTQFCFIRSNKIITLSLFISDLLSRNVENVDFWIFIQLIYFCRN